MGGVKPVTTPWVRWVRNAISGSVRVSCSRCAPSTTPPPPPHRCHRNRCSLPIPADLGTVLLEVRRDSLGHINLFSHSMMKVSYPVRSAVNKHRISWSVLQWVVTMWESQPLNSIILLLFSGLICMYTTHCSHCWCTYWTCRP